MGSDKNHPDNEKCTASPDFKGPCTNRKCTDLLCLLLLATCWFVMTVLGFIVTGAIDNSNLDAGDPRRLVNGIDYKGRICGVDGAVSSKENIYYLPSGAGVCISKCPELNDVTSFHCVDEVTGCNSTTVVGLATCYSEMRDLRCMYYIASTDVLNYCIPDVAISAAKSLADSLLADQCPGGNSTTTSNTTSSSALASCSACCSSDLATYSSGEDEATWFEEFMGDVYTARGYIFGFGIGIAVLLAFVYLLILRIPGVLSLVVWGTIFLILILLVALAGYMYGTASDWDSEDEPKSHTDTEIQALEYFSYFIFILAAIYLLLVLWMCKRIRLALGVVKEAARAVGAMPLIILYPIIQVIGVVIFLVPWTVYILYLASSGEVTTTTATSSEDSSVSIQYKTFEYTNNIRYAGLYFLFCWFWTSQFIIAVGQIVVAMAVSFWYFARDKSQIGSGTVLKAIRWSMFYHAGTAAYGSLIIAIIKTIRAVVAYFQKKAKNSGSKVLQAVLCCVQCCLWCFEKCMKFLNKNAYIQTAIYGYPFCKAARKAFFLILRNILRVAAVSLIGEFVMALGKLLVPLATAFLAYVAMENSLDAAMYGLMAPTIFVFLLAYFVMCMFNEVFGMAISTILQCFIADEEIFDNPAERYADGALASYINKSAAEAKQARKNKKIGVDADDGGGADVQVPVEQGGNGEAPP